MKLIDLLKDISDCQVKGSAERAINGMTANSKAVTAGSLFIAKKGRTFDGRQYIPEAIQAGASAILTDFFDPSLQNVVQIIHPNPSAIEGLLAANFYQHPSHELLMVGITGTNGKTTTSFLIKNLLDHFWGPCGLIGTIEYIIGNQRQRSTLTSPDVISNHLMLHQMVLAKSRSAVMEVSSHALDQGRVDQIEFDIAIFSNLTLDHLDYHGTMHNYGNAKKRLFQQLGKGKSKKKFSKWAIVNQDSPWSACMVEECSTSLLSYGIEKPADLQATQLQFTENGTRVQIAYQGKKEECFWPLVGRFNVYNCLAAMGALLSQNIPLEDIISHIAHIPFVRGRLELVQNKLGLKIYVDYSHTDDALLNVLATLKEVQVTSPGKLIVVFGCGGGRDPSKRPKMAQACEKYADLSILTSDNPRNEDPVKICEEAEAGFSKQSHYEVIVDRRAAIQRAIELAHPADMVLIAGRGHEPYQIFADKTIEFDDCKVAEEISHSLGLVTPF